MQNINAINSLINCFTKLSGVGYKTAERYAYRIIEMSNSDAKNFADTIMAVKNTVKLCKVCGNFTTDDECSLCKNRTSDTICVVSHPKEIATIEKCNAYNGLYHCLHGVISPLDKKGPEQLNIKSLFLRLRGGNIKEVIIALSPDVEGEATANYLASLIKPSGIKVSRLATGISMGSSLEYADEATLGSAIKNRTEI
ncbi:MAG: recombination mediator RecR [Christensenellaceae bacterium]|jgi:recombination protein RecR|nr:recombination mediator RecR [Christensenellaceae bacterium]